MAENYILFEIEDAAYAVRTSQVELIEMVETITRVPNAPGFVEGVTAVRGQVIPVISVRRRFRMPSAPTTMRSRLIITRLENRLVGMLVDTAREFAQISTEDIKAVEGLTGPGADYLDGIATLPDRLVLVVNLERLLSYEEREALPEPALVDAEAATGSPPGNLRKG